MQPVRPRACRIFVLGAISFVFGLTAQETPKAASNAELAALQTIYEAKLRDEVQQPRDAGIVDLNTKYIASLERALDSAQKAGKLDDALAAKGEIEAISTGKRVPPKDDAAVPESLKQLRETYRGALTSLDGDLAKRKHALQEGHARSLEALVVRLTKEGRLEEAVAARKQRDIIAAAAAKSGGFGKGIPVAANAGVVSPSPLVTEAQLVAKTWKHLVPTDKQGASVYTFKDDHTVTSSKGNKGKWTVKDDLLRIEMATNDFWVEMSLRPDPAYAELTLKELNCSRGKRPNAVMTQGE